METQGLNIHLTSSVLKEWRHGLKGSFLYCLNYGIYQNMFPMLMRQKREGRIVGLNSYIGRDPVTSQGLAIAGDLESSCILTGRVLRTSCRVGQVVDEGTSEFPDSLAFWEERDTGPCTALWGSRRDGHNLGALAGLDLEAGHVGSLDGMLCDLSEGLPLSQSPHL